ncbi:Lipoprotein signal peptidase (Prolipoprotein signal peptidase) (Signal peptidase II) (SPase II), partial [Durusdinium trenchii]
LQALDAGGFRYRLARPGRRHAVPGSGDGVELRHLIRSLPAGGGHGAVAARGGNARRHRAVLAVGSARGPAAGRMGLRPGDLGRHRQRHRPGRVGRGGGLLPLP